MLKSDIRKHVLQFRQASGTSRGILHTKDSWFLRIYDEQQSDIKGIGECSIIPGLSMDDRPDFEKKLTEVSNNILHYSRNKDLLNEFPAIRFGLETALLDFNNGANRLLFPSDFTDGETPIPINGLIWMGNPEFMLQQIRNKIDAGFRCLKMKIGAIDFEQELTILRKIRNEYSSQNLEIRLDANGAFHPDAAMDKIEKLSQFEIHSIEQPIRQNQFELMADLCQQTPIPIALDEELIGIYSLSKKQKLLDDIKPQYIILKPSLLGGFYPSQEWIHLAQEHSIGWWVTSALESNIGLNAIAQWTFTLSNDLPQGLGTGQLYTNNIESPLEINAGNLHYNTSKQWNLSALND